MNKLRSMLLFGALFGSFCFAPTASHATQVINSEADAFVRDGSYGTSNFGAETFLSTKFDGTSFAREAFVRFNLSGVTETISKAKVRLYISNLGADVLKAGITHRVSFVSTDSWSESSLTWNTKPAIGSQIAFYAPKQSGSYIEFDVTNLVKNEFGGDKKLSINVASTVKFPGLVEIQYASKESPTGKPELVINGTDPTPLPQTNPDAAANLNLTTSTYLGGSSTSDVAGGVDIASDGTVVYGGKLVGQNFGKTPVSLLGGGDGAVVRFGPGGTSVLSVTRLGSNILDLEVGEDNRIVVAASGIGAVVLNSTGSSVVWSKSLTSINRVAVGTDGTVAALNGKTILVYNASGTQIGSVTLGDGFVEDICVDSLNKHIIVTGFNNKSTGRLCDGNYPHSSCPVQVLYMKAYNYSSSMSHVWTDYNWPGSWLDGQDSTHNQQGNQMADTRGYRVAIGKDKKLYLAGISHGGNATMQYDPHVFERKLTATELVIYDIYNFNFNIGTPHITWYGRYNPLNGNIEKGQFALTRMEDGDGNGITPWAIDADEQGRVFVAGQCVRFIKDRASKLINNSPIPAYQGSELYVLVVSPDFNQRLIWHALSGSATGHNSIGQGIAVGAGKCAVVGDNGGGTMTIVSAVQSSRGSGSEGFMAVFDLAQLVGGTTPTPPSVSITSPASGTTYLAPASVAISATAADADGSVAKVEFFQGSSLLGSDLAAPYSITWSSVGVGNYNLTAKATDNAGATTTSSAVLITVSSTSTTTTAPSGSLTAGKSTQPASLSLSSEGTADWSHWGLNASSDWNHKSGITAQISNITKLGTATVGRFTDGTMSVNWSGGTPTASSAGTTTGVYQAGAGNGFQITAPADTTERVLKVYCGVWKSQGRLEASLSDGSAPVLVDTTHGSTTGSLNTIFTINFKAASAGQKLTVKWTVATSHDTAGGGTVGWQAATLSSGGVVDPCAGNTAPSVSISSPASGATYTAPASITINAGANDSTGTISKVEFFNGSSLLGSDPSSPYTFNWSNVGAGVYSLTARATDSCSATTTSSAVSVTVNASSSSSSNTAPTVSLTSPVAGATYTAPASVALAATASDSNGTVTGVDFLAGTTLLGSDATSPYSLTWGNVGTGVYTLTARASDNSGASTTSAGVSITVNSSSSAPTGSLSATKAAQPTSLSLNVEGSRDWSHWGLNAATDWNHKSGVTAQVSNFIKVGSGTVNRYTDGTMAVSWTGGTPTASATSTKAGVYVAGVNNGFQITVPADSTARTLKVYCGVWKSQGKLEATLSDGSAAAIVDTSHGSTTGSSNTAFTINYKAASAGQTLTVKWTVQTSHDTTGGGTVGWQAATLQ